MKDQSLASFYVDNLNKWEYRSADTLEDAQKLARKRAYENGEDVGIYKLAFVATAPEELVNIKINPVLS